MVFFMMKAIQKNLGARRSALVALGLLVLAGSGAVSSFETASAGVIDEGVLSNLQRPIVVELFTSEGCSSCPPADRVAGELADIPGVLPLSFHVDYWDYIGWKDPFASPLYSDRQRDYAHQLSLRYVYTPQMVVEGQFDVVGFRRGEIFDAIEKAAAAQVGPVMTIDTASGRLTVPAGAAPAEGATLWLALYDSEHTTDVPRGENAGSTLSHYNVVRELRPLGTWKGEALEVALDLSGADDNDGCAILLQTGTTGPILSALAMTLPTQ